MERKKILIGIGQSGCNIAELAAERNKEIGVFSAVIAVDTDKDALLAKRYADRAFVTFEDALGEVIDLDESGALSDIFFDKAEYENRAVLRSLSMNRGTNGFRAKGYVSLLAFLEDENKAGALCEKIDSALSLSCDMQSESENDEQNEAELYFAASLAGGTGSGMLIPLALFIKRYLNEKGIDNVKCKAFVTMPQIYSDKLSAEIKVKANANAYATLRELAAINDAAVNGRRVDEELFGAVKFGDGRLSKTGVLFDSSDEKFRCEDYLIFDNVYVFEKIPRVNSVSLAERTVVDAILFMANNKRDAERSEKEKKTDAVFGCVSLTRVSYSADSIAKYIVRNETERELAELTALSVESDREYRGAMMRIREYGYAPTKEGALYSDAVISVFERFAESEDAERLLSAFFDDEGKEMTEVFSDEELDLLDIQISDVFKEYTAEWLSSFYDDSKEGKKVRIYDSAREYYERLYEFFRAALADVRKYCTMTEEELAKTDMGRALEDAVYKGANGESPIKVLVRLAMIRRELHARSMKARIIPELYLDSEAQIPTEIYHPYLVLDRVKARGKYVKGGVNRFTELVFAEKDRYKGTDAEKKLLFADAMTVRERIFSDMSAVLYEQMLRLSDRMINGYREVLNAIEDGKAERLSDVRALLYECARSTTGNVYIGCTEQDKESMLELYRKYCEERDKNPRLKKSLGRTISELVAMGCDGYVHKKTAEALEKVTEEEIKEFKQSFFFAKYTDLLLFERILMSKQAQSEMRIAFSSDASPLRIDRNADARINGRIQKTTEIMLSVSTKEYLERKYGTENGEKTAEQILFDADAHADRVVFTSELSGGDAIVLSITDNISAGRIESIAETGRDSELYVAYRKAMREMRNKGTRLWDPFSSKDMRDGAPIVFADKRASERALDDLVLAYTYALTSERIVRRIRDGMHTALYIDKSGERTLCESESEISDISLMRVLFGEEEILEQLSGEIADMLVCDRKRFVMSGVGDIFVKEAVSKVLSCNLISALGGGVLSLAQRLLADGKERTAKRVLERANAAVLELIDGYKINKKADDAFITVYRAIVKKFEDEFTIVGGEDDAAFLSTVHEWGFFTSIPIGE